MRAFAERDVKYLTLFAFSTENWTRPRAEVNPLMRLAGRVLERELKACTRTACVCDIGSLEGRRPSSRGG